ncbi:hypothetical protein BCR35DRAFT_301829 [Leucosporidium creatinivorum]|uniref:TLC domain-domain-containing protein n=1 Tax=Leucosporidium creatinivorum TaxID=106004 RepID=A0A1Y2FXP1_9BASI|nr:hypothetical protein BCR35DRAFT_301829 [Leucosporidium creatinivorum]
MLPSSSPVDLLVHLSLFPNRYSATAYLSSLIALSLHYLLVVQLCGFALRSASHLSKDEIKQQKIKQVKMRSWILTGTAALIMTLGSIPFTWDLLKSGLDVAKVQQRSYVSQGLVAFFMAYLNLDLLIGCLHYRSQVSILTGWVHHSGYSILLWVLLRRGLSHVFAGAAIMELPTFVLALSMLVPATRNDMVFTVLFFVTRILYHSVLLTVYYSSYGRTNGSGLVELASEPVSTWIPAIGLTLAAPLHVSWFTSSTKGMLRRRRAARLATSPLEALPKKAPSPPSPLLLPQRPRLVSLASSYLASPRPSLLRLRTSTSSGSTGGPRRYNFEKEVSDYFSRLRTTLPMPAQDWLARDENDVLKAQAVFPITQLRMRAGKGGDDLRRLGGRVRRGMGAIVAGSLA